VFVIINSIRKPNIKINKIGVIFLVFPSNSNEMESKREAAAKIKKPFKSKSITGDL
jgi:hypothetical protein